MCTSDDNAPAGNLVVGARCHLVRNRAPAYTRVRLAFVSDPVLIAVEDDPAALPDLERELFDRYGTQYRVECIRSADHARARMQELADADADVALVLAAHGLAGTSGSDLLDESRRLHPNARRVLLIA